MTIERLQEPDYRALKMLAHCGNVATADLLVTGVSPTRIKSYKRDGLISEVLYCSVDSHFKQGEIRLIFPH